MVLGWFFLGKVLVFSYCNDRTFSLGVGGQLKQAARELGIPHGTNSMQAELKTWRTAGTREGATSDFETLAVLSGAAVEP